MQKVWLLVGILMLSGCAHEIVYKCPKGQVKILENRGTNMEQERCYTPGVSYVDYRPITTEVIQKG